MTKKNAISKRSSKNRNKHPARDSLEDRNISPSLPRRKGGAENTAGLIQISPYERLVALRSEYSEENRRHSTKLRRHIADAAGIACALRDDEDELSNFKNDAFWEQKQSPKDLMHAVMIYMGGTYKLASKRAIVAKHLLNHGVLPQEFYGELKKRGGVTKIYNKIKKPRAQAAKPEKSTDRTVKTYHDEEGSWEDAQMSAPYDNGEFDGVVRIELESDHFETIRDAEEGSYFKIVAVLADKDKLTLTATQLHAK
ncbi:hypothetical protein [Aquabacter cavernae]|uniref:hypothetical protein n=1 Tax=Aquabacter cavernae TaxID=2496029 RepID=UPI000F8D5D83|nr:hypothetical protein [Aquabacter cavernae]